MCYSAQIEAEYDKYVRKFGAILSIRDFVRLYWDRKQGAKIKIPKAMDAPFTHPKDDDERQIRPVARRITTTMRTSPRPPLGK